MAGDATIGSTVDLRMYIDSFFVVLTQGCGWQVLMKYYLGWSIL